MHDLDGSRTGQVSAVLTFGLALAFAPGVAAREHHAAKAEPPPRTAMFPIVSAHGVDAALVKEVSNRVEAAVDAANAHVLYGAALNAKLNGKAQAALDKCTTDLACVAKLGHRVKVIEVILGRAGDRPGGGAKVTMVAVSVTGARIERKVELDLITTADIAPQLPKAFREIFQVDFPVGGAAVAQNDPALVGSPKDELELALIPPEPAAPPPPKKAPTPAAAAPAPALVATPAPGMDALALEPLPIAPAPTAAPPTTPAKPASASTEPAILARPAAAPPETRADTGNPVNLSGPPPSAPARSSSWRMWLGASALAVGAAGVGTGAYFGKESRALYKEADDKKKTTLLRAVNVLQPKADADVNRANLLFGAGGGVMAIGAALLVWNFVRRPGPARSPMVSIAVDNGAQAVVAFAY